MAAQPLIIAFYGGPGCGKSVAAAETYALLKKRGVSVELASEFAKDLVWEKRWTAMGHQPYIAGEQMLRYDRLRGQVDVIVTDSSTLLGCVYGNPTPAFRAWLIDDWLRRKTLNIVIERPLDCAYEAKGRRQREESARALDARIEGMLRDAGVPYAKTARDEVAELAAATGEMLCA